MIELLFLICLPFDWNECGWDLQFVPMIMYEDEHEYGTFTVPIAIEVSTKTIIMPDRPYRLNFIFEEEGLTLWSYVFSIMEDSMPWYKEMERQASLLEET